MIELIVLNYLDGLLDVPVLMEKPTGALTEYVLIEKTGTSNENFIYSATFAVQSYSDTKLGAALLNEKVKEIMVGNGYSSYGITAIENISKCSLNSDYDFTDITTKQYRYQAVFDLVY